MPGTRHAHPASCAWALLVALLLAGAARAQPITVVSWGGAYSAAQRAAFHAPFSRRSGIAVVEDTYNGSLDPLRAQRAAGGVRWDVIDIDARAAAAGCSEGLLEPLRPEDLPPGIDGTPAAEDFLVRPVPGCVIAGSLRSLLVAYDPRAFPGAAPAGIADFFDLERFPGGRALRRAPQVNLEWALLADGVPRARVYEVLDTPSGTSRAFAVLGRLRAHLRWWSSVRDLLDLLGESQVVMSSGFNDVLVPAMLDGRLAHRPLWDGQAWELNLWAVARDSPRVDAARRFVAFATDTQRQADFARYLAYGPVRRSSLKFVQPQLLPYLPSAAPNLALGLRVDRQWWARNEARLAARFRDWLGPGARTAAPAGASAGAPGEAAPRGE